MIHFGRATRALFIALEGNGTGLQSDVEPDNGEEPQGATRPGNSLSSADRQRAQKDASVITRMVLLSGICTHQAIRANTYRWERFLIPHPCFGHYDDLVRICGLLRPPTRWTFGSRARKLQPLFQPLGPVEENTGMQISTWTRDEGREIRSYTDIGESWGETLQDALVTGSIVCVVTAATAALRGMSDSGSAIAPINATSHVIYGPKAGKVEVPNFKHTMLGLAINAGASVFWAAVYERLFGRAGNRGDVRRSLLGGGVVAALAYLVDYHLVPKRLTPGWEERVSGRSLGMIFGAMGLSLPVRSILKGSGTDASA